MIPGQHPIFTKLNLEHPFLLPQLVISGSVECHLADSLQSLFSAVNATEVISMQGHFLGVCRNPTNIFAKDW